MKPIEIQLPKETIKGLVNGATKFIIPIDKDINIEETRGDMLSYTTHIKGVKTSWSNDYIEAFIKEFSPLQISDIHFVQEKFIYSEIANSICYKNVADENLRDDLTDLELFDYQSVSWKDASQMTYEQSRLKDLVVVDVEIKRVQDLNVGEIVKVYGCDRFLYQDRIDEFIEWYNKQYNNYNENPYVFIVAIEDKQ